MYKKTYNIKITNFTVQYFKNSVNKHTPLELNSLLSALQVDNTKSV